MYRQLIVLAVLLCSLTGLAWSAEKKAAPFTQKECAILLLKQLGWDSGLPKDVTDRDYLVVLGGKRTFRYEAEHAYNAAADNVSVSEFEIYGPFSGKGWIMGVSTPTVVHFTLMLPIGGEYTLKSTLKGDRFIWKVNGKELIAGSPDTKLTEVMVGKLKLPAGVIQMEVTIPANGGIDSFTLSGADYSPVQPFAGWRFKEALTAGKLAEIIASANNQLKNLPVDAGSRPNFIAALDNVTSEPPLQAVETPYLGRFNSKKWMRSDYRGATVEFPLTIDTLGVYDVTLNLLAETVEGELNGTRFSLPGKPYLDMVSLGQQRLDPGSVKLTFKLPPMGGIDGVQLVRKDSSPAAFMKLVGMTGSPDRVVTETEALALIKTVTPRTIAK